MRFSFASRLLSPRAHSPGLVMKTKMLLTACSMIHGVSYGLNVVNTPPMHLGAKPIAHKSMQLHSSAIDHTPSTLLSAATTLVAGVDVELGSFFDDIPPSITSDAEKKAIARREAIARDEAIKAARASTAIARMEAEDERKVAAAERLAASGVPPCKFCALISNQCQITQLWETQNPLCARDPVRQARMWLSLVETLYFPKDRPAFCRQRFAHAIATASLNRASELEPS